MAALSPPPRNRELLLPYLLPYLAYTGTATLLAGSGSRELDYALRIVLCGAALAWGWRRYRPLLGPRPWPGSALLGVAAGLVGTALWIALVAPLAGPASEPWPIGAVALRVLAAVALVPLAEELLMRGYVLGFALQWQRARSAGAARPLEVALHGRSLAELEPGAWSVFAVAISTLLFAAGHQPHEWPAALAYGLWMACLWIVRRDLLSCVVAHSVTNLSLAATVLATGRWELW